MPHLSFILARDGPRLDVLIGLDADEMTSMQNVGLRVPSPLRVAGLIDTGADITGVAARIIQHFGLAHVQTLQSHTASGTIIVRLFDVSLSVSNSMPGSPILARPKLRVIELNALPPTIECVVGMDILSECLFILDGPGQRFTLGF